MTRTKLMLGSLIAGSLMVGVACKSDKGAERAPTEETRATPSPEEGTPEGTGGGGALEGELDRGPLEEPATGDREQGQNPEERGTGGSGDEGYEEDDSRFKESQELGGNKFPSDDTVPW
jgi:hypothetical protein